MNDGVACIGRHDELVEAETGWLCLRCYNRLRSQLVALPAVATWLEVNIATGGSPASDRVTGTADDPIPLRLDVLDLIGPAARNPAHADRQSFWQGTPDDQHGDLGIEPTLRAWSERVHWDRGRPWPDDSTITGLVAYLAANLSWIAEQPWVDEFQTEIATLTSKAARVAPWKPETRRVKDEACDTCGMRALVTHVAEGVTRCEKGMGGCGKQRDVSEYAYRARGREAS